MPPRTPVELAIEYFECQVVRRDVARLESLLSPDFEAHTPWGPKSRDEALAGWAAWMAQIDPATTMTVRHVEEISRGGVLIEITAHLRAPPGDPRGDLDLDVCDVMTIVDGRIAGLRAYFDRTGVEQYYARRARNAAGAATAG